MDIPEDLEPSFAEIKKSFTGKSVVKKTDMGIEMQ